MTTVQLVYDVLGGAGLGVFVAAIGRRLLGGWGMPGPSRPVVRPVPPVEDPTGLSLTDLTSPGTLSLAADELGVELRSSNVR